MTDPSLENVKCPDCKGEMVSRKGKYGVFWGCKNFPFCKGTRDSMGRSKADREAERLDERNELGRYDINEEYKRNKEDNIHWNKKFGEDRDSEKLEPIKEHTKTSWNKR